MRLPRSRIGSLGAAPEPRAVRRANPQSHPRALPGGRVGYLRGIVLNDEMELPDFVHNTVRNIVRKPKRPRRSRIGSLDAAPEPRAVPPGRGLCDCQIHNARRRLTVISVL